MAFERARRCELTELVADHVFRDVNRYVLAAIMDSNRVTDEIRKNRGTSRPGLDDLLIVSLVQGRDLLHQALCNVRSFFNRS